MAAVGQHQHDEGEGAGDFEQALRSIQPGTTNQPSENRWHPGTCNPGLVAATPICTHLVKDSAVARLLRLQPLQELLPGQALEFLLKFLPPCEHALGACRMLLDCKAPKHSKHSGIGTRLQVWTPAVGCLSYRRTAPQYGAADAMLPRTGRGTAALGPGSEAARLNLYVSIGANDTSNVQKCQLTECHNCKVSATPPMSSQVHRASMGGNLFKSVLVQRLMKAV